MSSPPPDAPDAPARGASATIALGQDAGGTPPITSRRARAASLGAAAWLVACAAAQPIAAYLRDNQSVIVHPARLAWIGAAIALAALAAVLVVCWRRPAAHPVAVGATAAALVQCTFAYGTVLSPYPTPDRRWVQLAVWVVLTAAVVALVRRIAASPTGRLAVGVWLTTAALVPVVSFTSSWRSAAVTIPTSTAAVATSTRPLERTPNIYWFVLDEYARHDVLAEVARTDDAALLTGLEDRGFDVAAHATTSYPRTHLSLASTLLMDWFAEPGSTMTTEYRTASRVVQGDNPVVERLRAAGYDFVHAADGGYEWSACDPSVADACLSAAGGALAVDEVLETLLHQTPLGTLLPLEQPSTTPPRVAAQLAARRSTRPTFVLAHVLAPHWPYRYDDACAERDDQQAPHLLTGEERRAAYATDVRCIGAATLEGIDAIVERDPDALIIVQSDHGSKLLGDLQEPPEAWDATERWERYGVLHATRLPGCPPLAEDHQLVNTFRAVLACLEGTEPELLAPRWFLSAFDDVTTIQEINPPLHPEAGRAGQGRAGES